jgi:hypothetical protein
MIQITLLYQYLAYDIEQLLEQYATARIEDTERRHEANLRRAESHEGDLIRRLALTGCSRLRSLLAKYLLRNAVDATDALGENASWNYTFKPSVNADGQMLADLMHWAVVRYAMSAWCKMQGAYREADKETEEAELQVASILETVKQLDMPLKMGKAEPVPEDIIYIHYGEEG